MKADDIGPNLTGIVQKTSYTWVKHFVSDPQKVLDQGDKRAIWLKEKYPSPMPAFSYLEDKTIDTLIAYLSSVVLSEEDIATDLDTSHFLENPILDTIERSGLILEIKELLTIPSSSIEKPMARINMLRENNQESNRQYVNDLRGRLYYIENNRPHMFLDLAAEMPNFIHQPGLGTGFGSIAFHPDYSNNHLFYTTHTEHPGSGASTFPYAYTLPVVVEWVLTEWHINQLHSKKFTGNHRELMRIKMPTGIHGVQNIKFNTALTKDHSERNLLYIGVGDGGSSIEGFLNLCCQTISAHGAILRIDPLGTNSQNGLYGIPINNPLVSRNRPEEIKELWAWGFRNPHRFCWDPINPDLMLAGDIGEHQIEEVNLINPGSNYGWNKREGTFRMMYQIENNYVLPLPIDDDVKNYVYPIAQYDHDEGKAIGSGFIYRGNRFPLLQGKYIFADIISDDIFCINVDKIEQGKQTEIKSLCISHKNQPTNFRSLIGKGRIDLHLSIDSKNNIYLLTKAEGKIWIVTGVRQDNDMVL